MSTDIVIVAATRTAVGKFGGSLAKTLKGADRKTGSGAKPPPDAAAYTGGGVCGTLGVGQVANEDVLNRIAARLDPQWREISAALGAPWITQRAPWLVQ